MYQIHILDYAWILRKYSLCICFLSWHIGFYTTPFIMIFFLLNTNFWDLVLLFCHVRHLVHYFSQQCIPHLESTFYVSVSLMNKPNYPNFCFHKQNSDEHLLLLFNIFREYTSPKGGVCWDFKDTHIYLHYLQPDLFPKWLNRLGIPVALHEASLFCTFLPILGIIWFSH